MAGGGCPDLGLVVLEEGDVRGDEFFADDLGPGGLGEADKVVRDHVADAPAAVGDEGLHGGAEELLALVVVEGLCDRDHRLDGQEADRVLVVVGEFAERRQEVVDEPVVRELLAKVAEGFRGGAADHGGVVVAQLGKHLDGLVLDGRGRFRVRGRVEGGGRGARGEPLSGREAADEGHIVLVDLVLAEDGADLVGRVGGLVADEGLFDAAQVFEDGEDEVGVLGPAEVLDKGLAEFVGEGEEDLVVVVERLLQEGDEFGAGAVRAEGEADGRDAVDGVESEGDVFGPQLVQEDCDRMERVRLPVGRRPDARGRRARTRPGGARTSEGWGYWMGVSLLHESRSVSGCKRACE